MPGRYQFSMPERRPRDGWFRLGPIDITTTALLVLLNIASMFWYAIDKASQTDLIFVGSLVRSGEVWRIFTWPLYAEPTVWVAITLAFFWFVGNVVEERVGRGRFTLLIVLMTVLPATIVTVLQITGTAGVAGLNLFALALLVVYALDNPSATAWFGIPIWVFAAVYVGLMILQYVGDGAYEALTMGLLVIIVAVVACRQWGMLDTLEFIPRFGSGASTKKAKTPKQRSRGGQTVVAGPWDGSSAVHSPLEEHELNLLLDKISAEGIDALSKPEKARLNELSKKLRGR